MKEINNTAKEIKNALSDMLVRYPKLSIVADLDKDIKNTFRPEEIFTDCRLSIIDLQVLQDDPSKAQICLRVSPRGDLPFKHPVKIMQSTSFSLLAPDSDMGDAMRRFMEILFKYPNHLFIPSVDREQCFGLRHIGYLCAGKIAIDDHVVGKPAFTICFLQNQICMMSKNF